MKKIFIPAFALFLFFSFFSCNKNDEDFERIEKEYLINCDVNFVFLDENNDGLINPEDATTFPFAYRDSFPQFKENEINRTHNSILYNGNVNEIKYGQEIDKTIWITLLWGFDNIQEYETYVFFNEYKTDTIKTKSVFTTDCFGRDYCAIINEIYYNGTLIYSDGEISEILKPEFIAIQKTSTETLIKIGKAE